MAGLFVLLLLVLLVAVMFVYYRYERKNKRMRDSRKNLLLGYDFLKGSTWQSLSSTKGTGQNPLKVVGEPHDQDALGKIFRPPTDGGIEKKDIGTIVVEDGGPTDEDAEKKEVVEIIVKDDSPTDEGVEKKAVVEIIEEDDSPTDEDAEKKAVVEIIEEDDSPTDEDVAKNVKGKMTYSEFQKLLLLADRMIASCAPRKSDYGKGYHMAIQIHFNNGQPGSLPDLYSIAEIARSNGCRNVHVFARGYRDGYLGLKPEYSG